MRLADKQCLVAITENGGDLILARSEWIRHHDVLIEESAEDNGFNHGWSKDLTPGVYLVTIHPWGYQGYDGEWDSGIDVKKIEPLWQASPEMMGVQS